ncbi:MAG TPA: HoxN/HupN/NixA family nickel/cobalt transporter [Stellaceae bacterium]|nr:HoxN/HupN/NixA family nickel/cobalt transporter [Stellaceae bacterium]
MLRAVWSALKDGEGSVARKLGGIYAILIAANLLAWLWALAAFRDYPVLLGTALLAYSFGARHAVDADHIAAIDNVTRKLMQQGKRPVGIGFFFSLGHSSVVALASAAIALAAAALQGRFSAFREVGGLIGTGVSAAFLFLIALVNLVVLVQLWRSFRRVRRGGRYVEADLDLFLAGRGLLARLFRPLFRFIGASWQMFPLGFLFALGFDTATEIGLLGISAAEAARGLSIWSILVFPALFTAGMSLVDTTDGVLMLGAYGWAFMKPLRRLYYNLTITFVSVMAAAVVGGIEALGLLADKLNAEGGFWRAVSALNSHFGSIGFLIIGLFIASWLVSMLVYRWKRYDEIEVTRG